MAWLVVRNARPRGLLGAAWAFLRGAPPPEYLGVTVRPFWHPDIELARVFPSFEWANSYCVDETAKARSFALGRVTVEWTERLPNIPTGDEHAENL
jgi:hypothetical protein